MVQTDEDPGPSSMAVQLNCLRCSELWDLAEMPSVVAYLARNKHLSVPPHLYDVLGINEVCARANMP